LNLDAAMAEELRELSPSSDALSQFFNRTPRHVTVYGVVELACLRANAPTDSKIYLLCETWAARSPLIRQAFDAMSMMRGSVVDDLWTAREAEFFPISSKLWDSNQHHCFESRFTQAAKKIGFGRKAEGFAGALREIADNVIQHSTADTTAPAPGLMGYFVDDNAISFAVGDVGRGILKSLQQNPRWAELTTSEQAIEAVIYENASRRIGLGPGTGFRQVFKSLVDLNGRFELRTDDAQISITGGATGREALIGSISPSVGVRVGVSVGTKRQVKEVEKSN
jgi:hypothetical protein